MGLADVQSLKALEEEIRQLEEENAAFEMPATSSTPVRGPASRTSLNVGPPTPQSSPPRTPPRTSPRGFPSPRTLLQDGKMDAMRENGVSHEHRPQFGQFRQVPQEPVFTQSRQVPPEPVLTQFTQVPPEPVHITDSVQHAPAHWSETSVSPGKGLSASTPSLGQNVAHPYSTLGYKRYSVPVVPPESRIWEPMAHTNREKIRRGRPRESLQSTQIEQLEGLTKTLGASLGWNNAC